MKRSLPLMFVVLYVGSALAGAKPLISKQQAEQDALNAVGGGNVTLILKEKELGKIIWSVDITAANEYEVWVDAHTGAILQVLTQPLGLQSAGFISQQQAQNDAVNAVHGGTVVQAQRDQWKGYQIWDIAITQPGFEYDVYVNARNGAILKTIKFANNANNPAAAVRHYISKAAAEKIALQAVGGGKVLLITLETSDNPVDWSVDVKATNGKEYEVKVNAYAGKVIAIIVGG